VCAFFSYSGEEDKVVLPFMRQGLHTGDKTVCILDQSLRSERLRWLSETCFDTADAEASGQLDVRFWENAPLQPARFDRDAMIELVEEVAEAGGNSLRARRAFGSTWNERCQTRWVPMTSPNTSHGSTASCRIMTWPRFVPMM
jgi:hypothetical protein